jgi:hypothetical protein
VLVSQGLEIVSQGLEIVSQGLELVNQGLELVSQGLDIASQGIELEQNITMSLPSHRSLPSKLAKTNLKYTVGLRSNELHYR